VASYLLLSLQRWVWRILAPLPLHKKARKVPGRKRKGRRQQRGQGQKRARRDGGEDTEGAARTGVPGGTESEPTAQRKTDGATRPHEILSASSWLWTRSPWGPWGGEQAAQAGAGATGEVQRRMQELMRGTMRGACEELRCTWSTWGGRAVPPAGVQPQSPPVPFLHGTALGGPLGPGQWCLPAFNSGLAH